MKTRLLASALVAFASAAASAADLVIEQSWKHGAWSASLFRDRDSGVRFCALDSVTNDTTFRIAEYERENYEREYVIAFFNPAWTLDPPATTEFTLIVGLGGGASYVGVLDATGSGTSVAYRSGEPDRYNHIREVVGGATSVTVQDITGRVIARYSGDGSAKALAAYKLCTTRL